MTKKEKNIATTMNRKNYKITLLWGKII